MNYSKEDHKLFRNSAEIILKELLNSIDSDFWNSLKNEEMQGRTESTMHEPYILKFVKDIVNSNKFFKNNKITFSESSNKSESYDFVLKHGKCLYPFNLKCPDFEKNSFDNTASKKAFLFPLLGEWDFSETYKDCFEKLKYAENLINKKPADYCFLVMFKNENINESYVRFLRDIDFHDNSIVRLNPNNFPCQFNFKALKYRKRKISVDTFYNNVVWAMGNSCLKDNKLREFSKNFNINNFVSKESEQLLFAY